MERLFQKSIGRKSVCLNGQWNITYDPENTGEKRGYCMGHNPVDSQIYVPSCWNFELGRYDYMGTVWYSRKFTTAETSHSRLVFNAVSGQAVVYLDGKELGSHYGSYTRFSFDIPSLPAAEHLLVVKVDNTVNDENTLPLKYVDWFVWGGIYRGVDLEQFEPLSIDRIRVDTQWNDYKVAKVQVNACVKNWSAKSVTDEFEIRVNGRKLARTNKTIKSGETGEVVFHLNDFTPELWDTENPNLYTIQVLCSSDDLIERTGFRKVETKETKVLLNGREIFIKGVNRHNDDPELGYAINPPLILRDIQIIKDLGANAIRGSHYPNDPVVLDYCDQFGLLFWEEIPFWNHPAEALANPLLEERARRTMREMIIRDYNHPSIIIWGIQNESKSSSPEGLRLFTKIADDIRSLDTSRLISFASACGRDDICFDLVDVVSWNMYPGWYDDMPLGDLKEKLAKALQGHRKWLDENGQTKPFLITEFGAGAIPGETTFDAGMRWTENYQLRLLENAINAIVESNAVQGFYIWQFCDIRTALPTKISIGRPRAYNNKGLVDEHRKPKLAYCTVKEMFKRIPTRK
jgi:beta-glucuronidase